jgi:hypothetical protein
MTEKVEIKQQCAHKCFIQILKFVARTLCMYNEFSEFINFSSLRLTDLLKPVPENALDALCVM